MRILIATFWILPHVGGVNQYVEIVRQALERRGHVVDVLAHGPDMTRLHMSDGRTRNEAPVRVFVAQRVRASEEWCRAREVQRYAFEICCAGFGLEHYDLIHTQDVISTRAVARVRPDAVAHVATLHGSLAMELEARALFEQAIYPYVRAEDRIGATSAMRTIVPSEAVRRQLAGLGVPPESLRVIPYGIDGQALIQKSLQPIGPLPTVAAKAPILLCAARFDQVKGLDYLIEAAGLLARRGRPFQLWIAGDGPLAQALSAQAARLRISDRVVFLGFRADVPQLMRRADVFVQPSVQDALPFSVIEAQTLGRPIVATRVAGIAEMIEDEQTGLLVPPKDPQSLADGIERLLGDAQLRDHMGSRAAAFARRAWHMGRMETELLSVYGEALSESRGRADRGPPMSVVGQADWLARVPSIYHIPDEAFADVLPLRRLAKLDVAITNMPPSRRV